MDDRHSRVIEIVAKNANLSKDRVYSSSRKREIICARHVAAYILRVHFGYGLSTIGRVLSRRFKRVHHTTVLHACTNVRNMLEIKDENYCTLYYKSMEDLENDNLTSKYQDAKLTVFYPEDVDVHHIIKVLNENFPSLTYSLNI